MVHTDRVKETDLYKKYVEKLIKEGRAYYAFDTNEDLINERRKERKRGLFSFMDSIIGYP